MTESTSVMVVSKSSSFSSVSLSLAIPSTPNSIMLTPRVDLVEIWACSQLATVDRADARPMAAGHRPLWISLVPRPHCERMGSISGNETSWPRVHGGNAVVQCSLAVSFFFAVNFPSAVEQRYRPRITICIGQGLNGGKRPHGSVLTHRASLQQISLH